MAVFAMNVSTTVGADVISINFGKNAIPAGATGDVGGVAAANWNNITGNDAAAVNGTHNLTGSSGTTYSAALTVSTPQAPWGPNNNTDTVLNAMQSSYLDLGAGNSWTITLNLDYISADYTLYFNGDSSGQYTAIKVNDVAYRGGEGVDNDEAGKTEHWGVRQTSTTMDDNNTIELENFTGNSVMTNIVSGNTSQRATISGMQVTLNEINEHTLGTGVTEASTLASSTGYLGITAAAGGSTLNLSNANLAGIQATANNLTVTGTGTVGRLWAKKDTVLTLSATLDAGSDVELGGLGSIAIAANQTLGFLSGAGSLSIADGVAVNVSQYDYTGTIVGGTGSALNIALSEGTSSTLNGITVSNVSGTVGMNALSSGITDVTAGNNTIIGISSAGGTLVVNGGPTVTLGSLSLSGNSETKLTVESGVSLVSGNLGALEIDATGRILTVGKGVSLSFLSEDTHSLSIGNGTVNIAGGQVTTDSLIMQNLGSGKTSVINITEGGLLEVTGVSEGAPSSFAGKARLGHWSGNGGALNVTDGEFRVLDSFVALGDDGSPTLNIGAKGIVNIKGLNVRNDSKINVSGILNIGTDGVTSTLASDRGDHGVSTVISLDGGQLGALSAEGWTGSRRVDIAADSTINLSVWDVESKLYTDTAANITLTGEITGSGVLTLAGTGRLIISSALSGDVASTGGKLALSGLAGFDVESTGALSGYGSSTTDGYAASETYRVAGAGSTLDKVTLIDGDTESEYAMSAGQIIIENPNATTFYVNTDVTRSGITTVREGTTYQLGENSSYHTDVLDDLGAISEVGANATVYLQNAEGTDILKITNVPASWKPNLTIEGSVITASAANYTANLAVMDGATLKLNANDSAGVSYANNTNRTITVQDGGTFDINGHEAFYHIVLEEGATLANSGAAVGPGGRNLALIDLDGDAVVETSTQLGVVAGGWGAATMKLNGNTLTKKGSGVFHIDNCTTDAGTIRIEEGKVHWLEYNGVQTSNASATTFEVCSNTDGSVKGTLQFGNEGRAVGSIGSLVASGGNVTVDGSRVVTVLNSLTGTGFTKQGTGSIALAAGMEISDDIAIAVEAGSITLSAIKVATGKTLAITGATTADSLSLSGKGALTISALTGGLISYGSDMGALTIESLSGDTVIDIFGMVGALDSGVNLGIKNTAENIALISVAAVEDGTWELVDDGTGYLKLQGKSGAALEIKTDWDINWGAAGLAGAPVTVPQQEAATGTVTLAYAAAEITGGGDAAALLVGGKDGEAGTGDTWMAVSGGTFDKIVGGNVCNNWNSGSAANLVGDSHILMKGGTAAYIIGANLNDAKGATFTGDTYVSVYEGATVTNSVVGGSTMSHNEGATLNGNTNVFIYTSLTGDGYVNGSSMYLSNARGTMTQNGSANITIDLSKYTGTAAFAKKVVGGSYLNNDATWGGSPASAINGDTNINIVGKSGVEFTGAIAGAAYVESPNTSNISGTAHINISGASAFSGVISGGTHFAAWENNTTAHSNTAATSITISGGSYTNSIVGGDVMMASGTYNSTVGDVKIAISGGTFTTTSPGGAGDSPYNHVIAGGSAILSNSANNTAPVLKAGSTAITITGGTIGTDIFGGHVDMKSASAGHALTASLGSSTITLNGSSAQVANIYGGSFTHRDNTGVTITQGDIIVDLIAGTVNGSVYAGGRQVHRSKMSTESTEVRISDGVTFSASGAVVSGGYQMGCTSHTTNATGNPSVITGDRTLVFNGATQDRSGVSFKDFDVIKVTEAASTVTLGALNMTDAVTVGGAGTIKLGAASTLSGGVTVESALNLNGKSLTGAVTVAEDGALIAGADGSAVTGALTLGDGSALDVSAGAIALGTSGLTLGQGIVLTNTTGELERGTHTLLTGVGSWNLTGSVHAGDVFASINGKSGDDIADYTLELVDGNLNLNVTFSRELSWAESNDIWADGAQFGATAEDIFVNGDKATFGALTANETVTVNGPITANTVSITAGEGKSYTFTAGTNGTISTGDLSVGAGSAIFGAGTLQVNDLSKVTIAEGGVLDMSAYSTKAVFNKFSSIASGDGQVVLNGGSGFANSVAHRIDLRDISGSGEITTSVDYKVKNDLAINGWNAGTLVLGGDFEVDGELRLETDAKVVVNGHALSANVLSMGHTSTGVEKLTLVSGSITTSHIANSAAGNHTFLMEGGTLELTGTEGVASGITTTITGGTLKSGDNSWSISGATVGGDAAGDVAIVTGTGTITLNGATLTATLDNSAGKLAVAGAIDITSAGYVTTTTPSEYSEAHNNGYVKTNTAFAVATTVDNLTVAAGTTWTVDGSAIGVTYDKGVVTLAGTDWGTKYYVTGADVTYSGIDKTNGEGEALTAVVLNGSGLTLDAALDGVAIEVAKEGQSVVDITSTTTLDSSGVTSDATHQLKLHGAGTYALANGVGTLGAGVVLGDSSSWTGTVAINGVNTTNMTELLNGLGNTQSTVAVAGLSGWFNTGSTAAPESNPCTVNLELIKGADETPAITINNLNSDNIANTQRYAVLSGNISGSGDIKFLCHSNNANTNNQVNYKFTGDVSGWDGAFINAGAYARTLHVHFAGSATTINADIKNDGNVESCKSKLTIGDDTTAAYTVNGDVDVNYVVVNQATTFNGSLAVSETLTNNGGMTLSNDLTLAAQLGGTGNVTGTNLALQGAANTAGDITLTGALTLGTDSVASTLTAGALDITGGITFNALAESQITAGSLAADLGLSISDALLLTQISQSATKSLTLMTVTELGGHDILLNGASEYDSADGQYRYTVGIGADGAVTITSKVNGLKWAGSDTSNLWSEGDSWSAGVAPTDSDSVVFNGGGCSEVLLQGEVVAQSVTIDIGADIAPEDVESESYEFNGSSATDKLTIEKNLSVNAGELTLGVQTVVNGRTEVVAGAVLNVIAGNMDSRFGLSNAGELNISTGQTPTAVSVAGGDLVNTGTIYNAGMLQAGYGVPGAENTPNIINSGSIENIGVVGVDGDLNNTGSYVQTDGRLVVLGDVNNSTDGASPGDMDISGGTVAVTGAINNSADLTVSGEGATVSAGSMVNTGGTLSIESGSVTVGSEETPGTLDNSNGTIALGGESTTGSLIVNGDLGNTGGSISVAGGSDLTVNGDVDNKAGGSISVTGGSSLVVSGDLDNTGGDLSLSDSSTTAAIGGDLIMTDGTAKGTLTVGEGTELTVGGDLAASNVDLAFGGNVTVGGDVEIGTLNNNGIFTANGSADTEVHIGTLTNNGTLSVGKETEDGLAGGHLDIGTLSGEGAVNVGKEGSLTINSATTFTGQLNNLGTLTITTTTLDSAQESEGQTAGNIITEGLTVTDNATGYNGGSYQLGNVQTDTLTIDGISPDTTRMSLSSLDSRTEGGKIKLVLSDIEDGTVTDGSYHLIELDEAMAGSIAEEFDLSNYGYNADGDYDRTLATVQSDYMQALLKANKYVTFSDVAPTDGVALLSGGTTDVYASITELSPELSVWNLNGTETMTEAGLTVLKDGKLVSDDILDNVQTVKVTGEQAIDLTGDITRVTLNNLTAAEGSATALTISGDGSADDSAAITTAADGFDGTLVLTKASADISGKVTTLQTGDDSAANLDLSDSAIEVTGTGVTLSGVVNKGSLNFGLGSDELGKEIIGGDVRLNGTAINVTQQDNSIVIDGVGAGVNTIADLGETSGSATVTLNGKGFDKYFSNARLEGGNVVADRNDSYVTDKLAPTSPNGAAGAALLDATLVYDNPQASREEMPDRAALLDAVDAGRVTDEELAAVAGASVATMGMALSGDVERQLRAIRNRTTSMGVNECVVNEGMPYFNAWVNAEGNRAELDKDGTLAGYTLDSWGGTVGFDVDFDPHFTAGLAITAMYGNLTADGPETKAEGDMDTYYVTLFARYAKSAWTHTFVGTIGLMDGSFDRTVNIGGANYQTEGDTDGMSFGLMYEVGYVMPLDEDATACLQPIFNVMLRHAGVGSYTEKGSDAALDVDSQSVTTLTFGLGARLQAVVGESLYNRASIFEARALVKADVGDRSSEVDVAFVGSSHTATVESAELGAVGVELGAGLTIPVGDDDGSIFIDGSVELRSGYTNVNGTVGYRINF